MDPTTPPSPRQGMEEAAAHTRRGLEATIFTAISTQMQQLMPTVPSSVLVPKPELLAIPYPLLLTLDPAAKHMAAEEARVEYLISNLTDTALLWGSAEWERQTSICTLVQVLSSSYAGSSD